MADKTVKHRLIRNLKKPVLLFKKYSLWLFALLRQLHTDIESLPTNVSHSFNASQINRH